jgi:hypothetical protein
MNKYLFKYNLNFILNDQERKKIHKNSNIENNSPRITII